jgi:peptidyl-dipeptidase Dcp
MELMMSVWSLRLHKYKDVASMQKIVDAEGGNFKISPWDYRYYSEKVRKEKYDLDQNVVKEYLQLENLREGMFWLLVSCLICSSRLLMFLYTMLT